ncbi:MAG: hypothetical protein KC964_13755 [Candidatus Omnitrophica bacterium]|nr:hypothetical protein [Candidatus Omnitrophota bacterium]MCA9441869.1 hypothetical protein [Candidatus Omnitrophota bacterium]
MPVRYGLKATHYQERLLELEEALVREWEAPKESGAEPLIIIDSAPLDRKRIFVIWSDWSGLNMEDRADIILSAYRKVAKNEDEYLSVSMIMGLTPEEAPKFGIQPEDYVSAG